MVPEFGRKIYGLDAASYLAPLKEKSILEVADVGWFSLQVGDRSGDISLLESVKIADLSPWLTDFAETAAAEQRPADSVCPLGYLAGKSSFRPRHGEPHLATPLRHRTRIDSG